MQEGKQPNEPGWVFRPGDKPDDSDNSSQLAPLQNETQPATADPELAPTPTAESPPSTDTAVTPDATDASSPDMVNQAPQKQPSPTNASEAHVEWTASEYIANPKSAGWYGLLGVSSAVLAIVAFIVTRDIVSTIVIAILGIIVGVFAARQPRTLTYAIDSQGIHAGQRFYPYASFKSFSVANEHAIGFISLLPLKRLMPPLIIHYPPEEEDRIAQTLAEYLPYEDHKPDVVDNITRRMRL